MRGINSLVPVDMQQFPLLLSLGLLQIDSLYTLYSKEQCKSYWQSPKVTEHASSILNYKLVSCEKKIYHHSNEWKTMSISPHSIIYQNEQNFHGLFALKDFIPQRQIIFPSPLNDRQIFKYVSE
ncbi:hypothetical protein NPIL_50941 [Nephila pilipes]|uniref:Uncharacterized protein n=1 Tax=Nephila pilipes TaxID=299642 RepID=A0A8X6TBS9_NEPPI|nr:hypothetical protein NPIL_50941 [Nephila pilipes]